MRNSFTWSISRKIKSAELYTVILYSIKHTFRMVIFQILIILNQIIQWCCGLHFPVNNREGRAAQICFLDSQWDCSSWGPLQRSHKAIALQEDAIISWQSEEKNTGVQEWRELWRSGDSGWEIWWGTEKCLNIFVLTGRQPHSLSHPLIFLSSRSERGETLTQGGWSHAALIIVNINYQIMSLIRQFFALSFVKF